MKNIKVTLLILTVFMKLVSAQEGNETTCVEHLCSASLLRCQTGRLAVENGCELCKCEENPSLQRRSCPLHGCTVGLLKCVGKLQRRNDGCTLCHCDEQGVQAAGLQPTSGARNITNSSDVCPPTHCDLNCEKLRRSPITGCPMCECDPYSEERDFCPNAQEIISGEGISRGSNNIVAGSTIPKYKISIGKLRKGFVPNQLHKITLKALDNNSPFKEFLVEIQSSPYNFERPRRKRKQRKKIAVTKESTGRRDGKQDCGAGYWTVESDDGGSAGWRPFPQCSTSASESDKSENKTTLTLTWVAPRCGCVVLRASVIDFTGSRVYYDDSLTRSFQPPPSSPRTGSGRLILPLYRLVCVRPSSAMKKRGKKNKGKARKAKRRDWIAVRCCASGKRYGMDKIKPRLRQTTALSKCTRRAVVRANSFRTRFTVEKKKCKDAFLTCCVLANSQRSGSTQHREASSESNPSRGTGSSAESGSTRRRGSSFQGERVRGARPKSRPQDSPTQSGRARKRQRNKGNGNRRRQKQQRQWRQRNNRRFRYRN